MESPCPMPPAVSVIVPFFRGSEFLDECLGSIAGQTFRNWEVIVVDDASPEPAARLIQRHGGLLAGNPLRLIRHETNRGVAAARNTGMHHARANLFAFLDGDDRWRPEFLETMVGLIGGRNIAFACSACERFDSASGQILGSIGPTVERMRDLASSIYEGNFLQPSATLMTRSVFETIGGYDEVPALRHIEDWDFSIRLVSWGIPVVWTDRLLVDYRSHPGASTADHEAAYRRAAMCLEKHRDYPFVSPLRRRRTRAQFWVWTSVSAAPRSRCQAWGDLWRAWQALPWFRQIWKPFVRLSLWPFWCWWQKRKRSRAMASRCTRVS